MIIGARLSIRLRLLLAGAWRRCSPVSLPVDAHAKKRRGGGTKVERESTRASRREAITEGTGSGRGGGDDAGSVDGAGASAREARTKTPATTQRPTARSPGSRTGDGETKTAAAAPPPRPDQRATPTPRSARRPSRRRRRAGGRWLELAVGARGFSRNLAYNDQVSPGLRQYQLPMGPAVVANIAFYPLALASSGPAAGIGIVADIEQVRRDLVADLAADATFPNGATFPTSMHEFSGGIRYRIPVGTAQIGLTVTGGEHAFWFVSGGGADRSQLEIPNTAYQFVRGGAGRAGGGDAGRSRSARERATATC